MTTIIVKNSDFSGGSISHYSPPVAGASVCAFVGDADPVISLKNFGSGPDLLAVGESVQIDPVFRRFNTNTFINTLAHRTPSTTVVVVYRNVPGAVGFGQVASSEREHADGGRRGLGFFRSPHDTSVSVGVFGTNEAGVYVQLVRAVPADPAPAVFIAGRFMPRLPTGAAVSPSRLTAPVAHYDYVSHINPTFGPDADESAYPIRLGASYRPGSGGDLDIGFVFIAPRVLSDDELATLYASVKRRFSAFGLVI